MMDTMFATEGWKALIEEAKQEIYQLQADALEAKSWDEVLVMKGHAERLALLVKLEEISDAQKALLEQDD